MSLNQNLNKILIIDFGSQFTQLIARRIRELGVFSEIVSHKKIKNKDIQEIKKIITSCENIFKNTKTLFEKNWIDFLELFNKKNISRKECLLLPLRTVLKALKI